MTAINGYRVLSQVEIDAINCIKREGTEVEQLINGLADKLAVGLHVPDPRWLAIARTHLQQGFMALVRSVAKPTGF